MRTLRIGCVKYLNARPLIHGWPGAIEFDHPSALCRKLARGDLDVALVSSIEYLRRPIYRIVDGVSIAANGPVYSVIVAHMKELGDVTEIEIDPASETSVALLRCLLGNRSVTARLRKTALPAVLPRLLIGDQAIRFRQKHSKVPVWDLAGEWNNITGLPFVFALWLMRVEVTDAFETGDRLRTLRDENLRRIDELIADEKAFDREFCGRYFRDNLRFDFGDQEKAGLREFHRQCLTCGIDVAPILELNVV